MNTEKKAVGNETNTPTTEENSAVLNAFTNEKDTGTFVLGSNSVAYAKLNSGYVPIKSKTFRRYLTAKLSNNMTIVPKKSMVTDTIDMLDAWVSVNKKHHNVHSRIANPKNGKIYLGLGKGQKIVEISSVNWKLIAQNDDLPLFIYKETQLAIPEPINGGTLLKFKALLNIKDDAFLQLIIFIMSVLRGHGPYFILNVIGPQGSAKSTLSYMIRQLIDPLNNPFNRLARTQRDMEVIAHNNDIVVLNNSRQFTALFSDILCRIATEGGASYRTLQKTDEETTLDINKPIIVNSISQVSDKPDFVDRSLCVHLPKITEANRRYEEDIKAEFEALRPEILGVLLDGVSAALANYKTTELTKKPRMADALRWAVAAAPGLGLNPDDLEKAFWKGQKRLIQDSIEASPTVIAVAAFMANLLKQSKESWKGSASELLSAIKAHVGNHGKLPATSNLLSRELQYVEPLLNAKGIELKRKRTSKGRLLILSSITKTAGEMHDSEASNDADNSNLAA